MSRSRRRHGGIGKPESVKFVKPNKKDKVEYAHRIGRRLLIEKGIIQDPKTRPKRYRYDWEYEGTMGQVLADNTSDARAMVKKELKVKTLPREVTIVRTYNIDHGIAAGKGLANLQTLSGTTSGRADGGQENSSNISGNGGGSQP